MRTGRAAPVAVAADGRLVRAADAVRGEAYRCPGCGVALLLRKGEQRRPHFAHRGGEACSGEGTLHRAGKDTVVRVVRACIAGEGPRPAISRACPAPGCDGGIVQDLPDDLTRAEEEVRLPGGRIADVVLYRGPTPAVAVEIAVTHAVDRAKGEALGLPWVELEAEQVLERPYWWVATQDGLHPFRCPRCARRAAERESALARVRRRAEEVAGRTGVDLPPGSRYASAAHRCWQCDAEMLLYAWPGGGRHSARRPPDPVPSSVAHCVTDAGDYWANCCPSCGAVQGDGHIGVSNADYALVRERFEEEWSGR